LRSGNLPDEDLDDISSQERRIAPDDPDDLGSEKFGDDLTTEG